MQGAGGEGGYWPNNGGKESKPEPEFVNVSGAQFQFNSSESISETVFLNFKGAQELIRRN
jgi:hypothetical protein